MEGQIDEQTKQDRYDILMQTQLEVSAALLEAKVGQEITVLSEGFDPLGGTHYGRSEADAPDVDGKIYFAPSDREEYPAGEFLRIRITEALDYDLMGEVID
jgi:ribosomal protein S12 methylthiotransferase